LSLIENSCSIEFNIIKQKPFKFDKKIYHNVYKVKDFKYYQELKKPNYRIYLSNKNHTNFSYNNSVWLSYKSLERKPYNIVAHEIMHMITGDMSHDFKKGILAPIKERSNHIDKHLCSQISLNNWTKKNNLEKYFTF